MPPMIEAVKANPSFVHQAKPFNSLKNQPEASAGYPAAHSRGLMSSLLQQEAQVDMQQALQELACDLDSIDATAREPPSRADAVPEEPKVSHAKNKKAHHRSKSVSYLLTQEDVVKAKKSANPKIAKSDLLQMGGETEKHLTTPNNPMKFRAAPEVETPMLSESPEVLLHIYEVGEFSPGMQKMLTTVLGRSALHVGVEIYGQEWSFGQSNAPNSMSGITSSINPKTHACHRYKETMSLGRTSMNPDQVRSLIKSMDFMWLASEYHPLRRNCVNFAEELCHKLGVEQPPAYVGALGRSLKNFLLV